MNTNTTASAAIRNQFDAIDKKAKLQRDIITAFATNVDAFVASFKDTEARNAAYGLSSKVVNYLATSLFAESGGEVYAPIRLRSQNSGVPTSSAPKSVTFAGMAKTLKNSGADFHGPNPAKSSTPSTRPTFSTGGGSLNSASTSVSANQREDRRILVTVQPSTLLNRPEPYALRRALCDRISGLAITAIPSITPTRTGWALNPVDIATRNLLLAQENKETPTSPGRQRCQNSPEMAQLCCAWRPQ